MRNMRTIYKGTLGSKMDICWDLFTNGLREVAAQDIRFDHVP
jgi:hypothetical protein